MSVKNFKELNQNNDILHIGNVWDVQSALIMEKIGYKAIGTSSLAIANSLGYEDGEEISFDVLCEISKQIISKVKIPLSVDIEGGYSRDIKQIIENIITLYDIGVVGINIEDSVIKNGVRVILPKEEFANIIKEIKTILQNKNRCLFINVRTDNFIMGLNKPLEDTIQRIKLYEVFGADGVFVPCIVNISDIKQVISTTNLPVNIMAMPDLNDFNTLQKAGVKRISQGPFIYNCIIEFFEKKLVEINKNSSFTGLFK